MQYDEARDEFIQTWGTLATQWGINRTMAQIHALLMISPEPLDTDTVMAQLQISRGNANMNLRDLIDWGIVNKRLIPGERKEFFVAEKDVWKLARQIAKERRRREITPVIETLERLKTVDVSTPEGQQFLQVITDLSQVVNFADSTLNAVVKAEENWLISQFLKVFR